MTEVPAQEPAHEIVCPHCKKTFRGELLGANEKQGFKCPHCRLFVPYDRAPEKDAVERVDGL